MTVDLPIAAFGSDELAGGHFSIRQIFSSLSRSLIGTSQPESAVIGGCL